MKRRRAKNSGGETLVETIVAFAVLMVLLTMATTAVRAGIALNNHAIERVVATEAASAAVERGEGSETGFGTIAIVAPDGDRAEIPVIVKQAGEDAALRYFKVQD